MDETHVVTVFLRNQAEILLCRRSDEVGSYPGMWGAVAGHAEGDPDALARQEIREETGIRNEEVSLARRGDQFDVVDRDRGTRWVVHPYLFDCETRVVDTNWEIDEDEWAPPTEILRRETVPDLWTTYWRVAPTVESVRENREHGSAYLSIRALEVLRDRAALGVERDEYEWDDLAAIARELRNARSGMAAVRNRVNRVMAEAEDLTPGAVEEVAHREIVTASVADDGAAANAAELVASASVVTLSRSGTVEQAIRDAAPEAVTVTESRPGGEGVAVAEALAEQCDVTLTVDANLPDTVAEADVVLVGADTVRADGTVVNKVGTRAAALAAAREDIPFYVVCARDKILPDQAEVEDELVASAPEEIYDGDVDLTVSAPLFEATPPDLVDGVVTEDGILGTTEVATVALDLSEQAAWDATDENEPTE